MGRMRYVSIVAVISAGFGAVLMFVIGAVKVIRAYDAYIGNGLMNNVEVGYAAKQAIAFLVQGIDAFLIALALMIFSGGVYSLFVRGRKSSGVGENGTGRISSISQLKNIIAELIVIILFVKFLEEILGSNANIYQWELLALPVSIMFLALSLKFLNLKGRED